jgi:ERF superfamily
VSLTTVLAHASGEWIASDWPVCALREMAAPRRMGAALTYARRYALFTLVGIAGEDDDAPDLGGQSAKEPENYPPRGDQKANGRGRDEPLGSFAAKRKPWSPPKQVLDPNKSAGLRDRLLGELIAITVPEELTTWAQRSLPAKNTLTSDDAAKVEAEFASHLAALANNGSPESAPPSRDVDGPPEPPGRAALIAALRASVELSGATGAGVSSLPEGTPSGGERVNDAASWHIDKSALPLSEPRRYRDREHLKFVSLQPCVVCGRRPSDAHHMRFMQPRALGRRVSDEFVVPLCRTHHRSLHRAGDEPAWWVERNLDPITLAGKLWERTRLINGALLQRGVATPSGTGEAITPESGRSNP